MCACNCNCVANSITSTGAGVSGCLPKIYTPKATGTLVERDIRDRLAEIVNVKDYGAIGDGLTDDTNAWNTFTLVQGGVKYIPKGEYRANGVIKNFPEGRIVGYVPEADFITHQQIDAMFEQGWHYTYIPLPTYL